MDLQAIRIKIGEHIAEPMNTQVRQKHELRNSNSNIIEDLSTDSHFENKWKKYGSPLK